MLPKSPPRFKETPYNKQQYNYNTLTDKYAQKPGPLSRYPGGKDSPTVEYIRTLYFSADVLKDHTAILVAYNWVMEDFLKTRGEQFSKWRGLPDITMEYEFKNRISLRWSARVPKHELHIRETDEEGLWDE